MQQYEQAFGTAELLVKHLKGELNEKEQQELDAWLSADNANSQLLQQLEDDAKLQHELQFFETTNTEKALQNVMDRVGERGKVVEINHNRRRWWYAAAVILILSGAAFMYKLIDGGKGEKKLVQAPGTKTDVAPGGNKAVLTLADGSTIILDSAANGKLTQQGNTKILKLNNGQLAYNSADEKPTEVLYNTVSTPRGGQYQLTLADGSKVWLNAATSIRFPASFVGTERRVEITGEAYFEVAKNAAMPFKVAIAGKGEVEVLGTHFNVNSYSDEPTINTTLLEGKVKVSATDSRLPTPDSRLLTPGQQALINSEGQVTLNKRPDIESVMAWKNEKFIFHDSDLRFIMRQLERWYDVNVVYDGNVPDEKFVGIISRNVNVSQILKMLETVGTVKFEISGKKIIVK